MIKPHARTLERAFSWIVRLWPTRSRHWALAMQAELPETKSARESLLWFAGGMMSLGKAWWREIWRRRGAGEAEPPGVKTPGPVAAGFLLAAVIFLVFSPSAREGLSTVLSAWNPRGYSSYQEVLRTMSREAETRGDARTLAFISLTLEPSPESARLADRAVALDPSLTWIYARVLDQRYESLLGPHAREWATRLEQWDPQNAEPYLVEGQLQEHPYFLRGIYPHQPDAVPGLMDRVEHDPIWLAALEKAFAAPRYDTYMDRWMALRRGVLDTHGLRQPRLVAFGNSFYPFGLGTGWKYGQFLLDQAVEAQKRGDTALAARNGWKVVQFAERVRVHSQTDAERMSMTGILRRAYAVLAPLEAADGHGNFARLLADESALFAHELVGRHGMTVRQFDPSVDAASVVLHTAAAGVALCSAAMFLCLLWLLLARLEIATRSGRLYRWVCRGARFAPIGLLASVIVLAVSFQPYAQALREYFSGAASDATALRNITGSLWAPLRVPDRVLSLLFRPSYIVYFWGGLLGVSIVAGVLVLCRRSFRRAVNAA